MAGALHTAGAPIRLECVRCGTSFDHIVASRGRYPRFCSTECRNEAVKGYRPKAELVPLQCAHCGATALRMPTARFCSESCSSKAAHRRAVASGKRPQGGGHTPVDRQCKGCSTTFKVRNDNDRVFCSDPCKARYRLRRKPVASVSVTIAKCKCVECGTRFDGRRLKPFCSAKCRALHKGKQQAASRPPCLCPGCGVEFIRAYGRGHSVYCSSECAAKTLKRIGRAARKARERSATVERVDPIKVFDRDGWKCHLCGRPTPRRLRGTYNDRAPELDHLHPLSKGGEHSYRNTACACRKCNGVKGDREVGQLRLFG